MPAPSESDRTETSRYVEHRPDETPIDAVVSAVAEETGRSPLEMDPLWNSVDTDALDLLCGSPDDRRSSVTVTFDYCDRRVTVTADGVEIAPSDASE